MERVEAVQSIRSSIILPAIVCGLGALFYLYEYILQVSPGVMTLELMKEFAVDAAGLGTMSAFYFYAYGAMQIPAGLLYDRYGPRRLISLALMICAIGALFFASTTNVALASAGRFFMGFGSAFSFIGILLLISRWYPARYFALLAGTAQFMSSIGAIVGEKPLADAVGLIGWRNSMIDLAYVGIFLALLSWFLIRDYPKSAVKEEKSQASMKMITRLKRVCSKPQTWCVAGYNFFIWAPIATFAGLWGIPYLMACYHVDASTASLGVILVWLGVGIGSPLLGWFSDYIGKRCLPLVLVAMLGGISMLVMFTTHQLPIHLMYGLLFCTGLAGAGQPLSFSLVKENNPSDIAGTAMGFNNMTPIAGGAIFQPVVGMLLVYFSNGTVVNGVHFYTANNYRHALLVLPICFFGAAIFALFFIKETNCQPGSSIEY